MSSEKEQFDIAQAVKNMRDNLPAMLEHAEIKAAVTYKQYTAYRAQGFTEAQAIELCKK